jgi:spermidine synthase
VSPAFVAPPLRLAGPLLLFGTAIGLSAWLLFLVQPMFAKMALPLLGGAPAVWNTALVFFQAMLLLGYLYAHALGTRLPLRLQVLVHAGVLAGAFLVLPVAIGPGWREPSETLPVAWLLGLFAASVGLPFLALSATSPLLQRWLAETSHTSARDPYFLYGASNLGSLLALVAYPLLIEPRLALADQSGLWTAGYALLALAIGAAGYHAVRRGTRAGTATGETTAVPSPGWRVRLHWLALAFAPAALLVAVTSYISADIGAVPLLWIVPLTLYLLSFVLVFARRPLVSGRGLLLVQMLLLVGTAFMATWTLEDHYFAAAAVVLATLFVTALVCHGRLAALRPAARHLTEFYVWLSLGGILGSAFAALLAPLLFDRVIELPLLCAVAALLRPRTDMTDEKRAARFRLAASALLRDVSFPLVGLALVLMLAPRLESPRGATAMLLMALIVLFGLVFTMLSAGRPLRFGASVAAIAVFGLQFSAGTSSAVVHRERTFFGVHVLKRGSYPGYLVFVNGNTVHGAQHMAPARRRERHTYYHAGTGIGRIHAALAAAERLPRRIGVIGLGAGEVACYAEPGQAWTFFEIDPAVARIASRGDWFRFLPECAPNARIVIGDGRMTLAREPAGGFDLLILDAFSSDSIPTHLFTREALRLYLDKLAPGGLILLHISNRYVDLEPVAAALAADARLAARIFDTAGARREEAYPYRYISFWVALARDEAPLSALTVGFDAALPNAWGRWRALAARPGLRLWTDDYSNIVSVLRWPGAPHAQATAPR